MAHPAVQTRDNTETRPATARNAVLWALKIAVAAFFLVSGFTKLTGVAEMVALFGAIGAGQWFRYLTGALEMGGAGLLLGPGRSGIGALLLACIMAGAIMTHLILIGGSAATAATLFVVTSFIAIVRRKDIFRLAQRSSAGTGFSN